MDFINILSLRSLRLCGDSLIGFLCVSAVKNTFADTLPVLCFS